MNYAPRLSELVTSVRSSQYPVSVCAPSFGEIRVAVETEVGDLQVIVLSWAATLTMADFVRVVRELSCSAVELCQIQLNNASSTDIDKLAANLGRHNVDVIAVPIDLGNLATPDTTRRDSYLSEIQPWIDLAARFEAPFARVNAGSPLGGPSDSELGLVNASGDLADYASERDVSLLVENHGSPSSDPEWLIDLLEIVGTERIGLILDTGDFDPMLAAAAARHARDPLDESAIDFEPIYDAMVRLAPYATVVHAKAYDAANDGTFGPIDLHRALTLPRQTGFDRTHCRLPTTSPTRFSCGAQVPDRSTDLGRHPRCSAFACLDPG